MLAVVFNHPIEAWIPVFLFAALFGLSMDYEVFMVSRIREAHDAGEDDTTAVAHGLEQTGGIITAAAAIMVAAFSGFVVGRIEGLREFGLGLRVAVTLDATIVRAILVPSADGRARPLELVAAEAAKAAAPAPSQGVRERCCSTTPPRAGTTYLTTVIAKRIAGSWYPSASPGRSVAYESIGIIP